MRLAGNYNFAYLHWLACLCCWPWQVSVSDALTSITAAPAQILGLKQKGQLAVGKDADMLLLNSQDLTLDTVLAKGRCLVRAGTPIVWGTFEKPQHSTTGG